MYPTPLGRPGPGSSRTLDSVPQQSGPILRLTAVLPPQEQLLNEKLCSQFPTLQKTLELNQGQQAQTVAVTIQEV